MNKSVRIIVIAIGVLLSTYIFLAQINVIKLYTMASSGNEPNLKLDSKFWVSNLINFENGDFICYKYEDEEFGKQIRIFRLVGKEEDTIEIKNGILFLNGEIFNKTIDLKHFYTINYTKYDSLLKSDKIEKPKNGYRKEDIVIINLSDKLAEEIGVSDKMKISPKGKADKNIKLIFNEDWNVDNFGPIKIPNNKCFVIGDNRHNSLDSRYTGFIDISEVVGTLIIK